MARQTTSPPDRFPFRRPTLSRCRGAPAGTGTLGGARPRLDGERILPRRVPDRDAFGGGWVSSGSGTETYDPQPEDGRGVRGPNPHLSRLRRQLHLLGRRAALLRGEGAAERAPALPDVPRECETRPDGRTAPVPRCRLQRLWKPGDGALRAANRPPGLLLELLRQGPRRADPGGSRAGPFLTSPGVG